MVMAMPPLAFEMIEPIAILRHAVLGIGRLMRCRHDAVLEGEMLEPVGLEEGVVGCGHSWWLKFNC
jgi:hypothetical protein